MGSPTYGATSVDWENRLSMPRLREQRLDRLKAELDRSDIGSLLSFDFHNIRYMTATHIGTWAMDKMIRFAILAARRRTRFCGTSVRRPATTSSTHRGWMTRTTMNGDHTTGQGPASQRCGEPFRRLPGAPRTLPRRSTRCSPSTGCPASPIGVDIVEPPVLFALQALGSPSSTASRSSSRPAGSRRSTRSGCSRTPCRWSMRPTSSSTTSCGPACGRTSAWAWSARCSTTSVPSTSRASTRSPASAAHRTRTCSPTG